jgi:hypothetical protein
MSAVAPLEAQAWLWSLPKAEEWQWVVLCCPQCGEKHTHGGGQRGSDPRVLLVECVSQCLIGPQPTTCRLVDANPERTERVLTSFARRRFGRVEEMPWLMVDTRVRRFELGTDSLDELWLATSRALSRETTHAAWRKEHRGRSLCGSRVIGNSPELPTEAKCARCRELIGLLPLPPIQRERPARPPRRYLNGGYVLIAIAGAKPVFEHVLVMEAKLGRKLNRPFETVHHINGVRHDNRPENLELWVGGVRYGQRAHELTCLNCGEPWSVTAGRFAWTGA